MNEDKEFMEDEAHKAVSISRNKGFFETSAPVRWFIGIFFSLIIFSTLHFREVRVPLPKLASFATHPVSADVGFEYFDDETTNTLKEESVRDIGHIYQIDRDQVASRSAEFRTYLFSKDWRKQLELSTFEEVWQAGVLLSEALVKGRFTDGRTFQKMKEVNYSHRHYQVFVPVSENLEEMSFPDRIWDQVAALAFSEKIMQTATIDFVVDYFKRKTWNLKSDYSSRSELKNEVKKKVPPFKSRVNKGDSILIDKERVGSRHIAMLQEMKKAISDERNVWHLQTLLGTLVITSLFTAISAVFLRRNHKHIFFSNRKLALIVSVIALTILIAKVLELLLLNTSNVVLDRVRYPLLVPFASVLVCSLLHSRVAFVVSGFMSVVLMMSLAAKRDGFLTMNLIVSFVTILSTKSLRRRQEIFIVCMKGWVASVFVVVAYNLHSSTFLPEILLFDCLSSFIFMLFTAVLVVGLLAVFESIFGIMTDITLMEYMDPNHELLRRLSIEVPGTYQHSLVVGSLSETASVAIGANGLFCRVATLYHDIGKLITPQYFTENHQGDVNIHQLLTPKESAQVIIAHVSEGVTIARKASLPEQFIDIIKEHHGTTLVYYFYHKHKENVGKEKAIEDKELFRYMGPKPKSKESAIIMIADTVEAASRSLEEFSEEAVMELVYRLVREKAEDGQFEECCLTFEELGVVQKTMIKTLVAAGHSRIKYPKREDEKKNL
ncbi:Uncharacterized protein AB751O23_AD_00230 [Chlamydiales bacterium SCGC AB-751-O23]|jgi:cyclic-di-AMP phosphodiesterase PgpH|nr:Uncharacterized protein AB751O23_AD_00230 [Chlamydiales bacterium SCGC AB-751-O23]